MYVFGGCTSTSTTFNDLWRLDCTTRTWSRPISTGTYPSPKACAVMVLYERQNCLILFGGWTHPSLYPLHQVMNSRQFNSSCWPINCALFFLPVLASVQRAASLRHIVEPVDARAAQLEREASRHGRTLGLRARRRDGRLRRAAQAEEQYRTVLELKRHLVLQPREYVP